MPRIPIAALRCLLAALLVLAPACSRRAERLVGNERLARGPGGLGETSDTLSVADRDTWVQVGTRKAGAAEVLVGNSGLSEAVTLFKVSSFGIPDTNASNLSIKQVALFAVSVSRDSVGPTDRKIRISLGESQNDWNASTVVWDDRGVSASLGEEDYAFSTNSFVLFLNLASPLDTLKWWHAHPDWRGFQLTAVSSGMAAFRADSMWFRVTYDTTSGAQDPVVIDTPVRNPLYLHAPLPGLATGGEDSLRLGGPEGAAAALHFAIPSIPDGAAINGAELRLRVAALADSTPYLQHAASIDVELREAGTDWAESTTGDSALVSGPPIAIRRRYQYRGVSDSLLTITIPAATVRGWRASSGTNRGVLLTVPRGKAWPALLLDSRESARAPILRLTYTSPPGGRF